MRQKACEDLLVEAGIKVTRARVAILNFISRNHGPHTVEELHANCAVPCDLATVYRSIGLLENHNLIHSCDFRDGSKRYEYNPEGAGHHHHLICRKCCTYLSVPLCIPEAWRREVGKLGYSQISHRLEFFGLCPDCMD